MRRVAIIGLGVIGASLGMALREFRPELEVLGLDADSGTITKAIEMGAITRPLMDEDYAGCKIIFIAVPLRTIPKVLLQIRDQLAPGTTVTDVGSVKSWVMEQYQNYLPNNVCCIGGHPLAGSDRSGITGADKYLLQNAVYVLTPLPNTSQANVDELKELIEATGAQVMITTPAKHDQMVSKVSHLPHIVAASLMNNLHNQPDALRLAAGGMRDTTRIAASNPSLWEDILLFNRSAVADEIGNLIAQLQDYREAISEYNSQKLLKYLTEAQQMRKNLPIGRSSLLNSADIVTIVPDRPGIIGFLGNLLGSAGININDIQIMGVRDENEGSIRLGVPQDQAQQALKLLKDEGIKAWQRD